MGKGAASPGGAQQTHTGSASNPHWFGMGECEAPRGCCYGPGPSSRDLGTLEGR